jgi:uncharacterized protein YxeA
MKLILLFILAINANAIYSREYLRNQVNELKNEYIQEGVKYIENNILSLAKIGHTQYTTLTIPDCVEYSKQITQYNQRSCSEEGCEDQNNARNKDHIFQDPKICEYVINEIHIEITKKFPDSNIQYNKKTRRYRITW